MARRDSLSGEWMMFWDIRGARNHMVDNITCWGLLLGALGSKAREDQDSHAPYRVIAAGINFMGNGRLG